MDFIWLVTMQHEDLYVRVSNVAMSVHESMTYAYSALELYLSRARHT